MVMGGERPRHIKEEQVWNSGGRGINEPVACKLAADQYT